MSISFHSFLFVFKYAFNEELNQILPERKLCIQQFSNLAKAAILPKSIKSQDKTTNKSIIYLSYISCKALTLFDDKFFNQIVLFLFVWINFIMANDASKDNKTILIIIKVLGH